MYLDTFGNIWFLNSLGLDMYDGQFNQYNFIGTHYITSSDFKIVYQDRIGNMWFATDEPTSTPSVLKYKDGEFTLYSTIGEHFISNAGAVKSIYESTNGDI
jgi:phenylpropionate dioxygenase-like ring-hydroxylating dioxygenase large terminal subunit